RSATPALENLPPSSAATLHMQRASSVSTMSTAATITTQPQHQSRSRVHARQESIDPGETVHQERMQQMQTRLDELRRQKAEKEMMDQIQSLEQELNP